MSNEKENKKTPWGEFQSRVRDLTKLNFRENVKLSSFLKSEKAMSEWSDIEILQRAIYWCMNVYEKVDKVEKTDKDEKVDKVEKTDKDEKVEKTDKDEKLETPKPENFEIDKDFKGLFDIHFVAKNKSLEGIIFRKFKNTYVSRGKVENLTNPAPKDYWKSMENLNEDDIEKIHLFGIKCFQDVPILSSECKDTGFFCFDDNKTIVDSPLKNLVFKEKTKGFVCVGKIEGLTNPYDKEICNLIELNDEEKLLLEDLSYKYDYTKYKKNLEVKIPKPKKEKVKTPKETSSVVDENPKEVYSFEESKIESIEESKIESIEESSAPLHIRKKNIPKYIKTLVWNKYIGDGISKAKCLCCKETEIRNTSFHCGHVVAFDKGGDLNINNLRPVCSHCNLSMGTRDMRSFAKEFFGWDI
jgi:hypothetical protein